MFGSTLGFWVIHSASCSWLFRQCLLLLVWVSGQSSHLLATPTSSEPPLPRHILQAGQLIGQGFCGQAGVPVPPLETLPCYKRGSVQAPFPPLLEVLARVTLMYFRKCPLNQVSTLCSKFPSILVISSHTLSLCPSLLLPVPTLVCSQSACKIYSIYPSRETPAYLPLPPNPQASLLHSLSGLWIVV